MATPSNMSGIIGKNKFKKSDNHPAFTGMATINDEVFRVAGWKNTSDAGEAFITLKFSEAEEKVPPKKKVEKKVEFDDDDFPF